MALCLYYDPGLSIAHAPALLFACWNDGSIVYSSNITRGGPPYYQGSVGLASLSDVTREACLGVSRFDALVPVDAPSVHLIVRCNGTERRTATVHEFLKGSYASRDFQAWWSDLRVLLASAIQDVEVTSYEGRIAFAVQQ
jgi:hypothetical protein